MSPFYSPFFLNAQVSLGFAGLLICESSVECIASDFWTVSVSVSGWVLFRFVQQFVKLCLQFFTLWQI